MLTITSVLLVGSLYYLFKVIKSEARIQILESCSVICLCLIGYSVFVKPRKMPGQILILNVCVTEAIAFWSYNAGLVSFLTVETYEYPVQTLLVSDMISFYPCDQI